MDDFEERFNERLSGEIAKKLDSDKISVMDYLEDLEIDEDGLRHLAENVPAFNLALIAFDIGYGSGRAGYDVDDEEEVIFFSFIDDMREYLLKNRLAKIRIGGFN